MKEFSLPSIEQTDNPDILPYLAQEEKEIISEYKNMVVWEEAKEMIDHLYDEYIDRSQKITPEALGPLLGFLEKEKKLFLQLEAIGQKHQTESEDNPLTCFVKEAREMREVGINSVTDFFEDKTYRKSLSPETGEVLKSAGLRKKRSKAVNELLGENPGFSDGSLAIEELEELVRIKEELKYISLLKNPDPESSSDIYRQLEEAGAMLKRTAQSDLGKHQWVEKFLERQNTILIVLKNRFNQKSK